MNKSVESAFQFPAVILMHQDVNGFRDPTNAAYEIAIQQPRQHRRFVNFFVWGESLTMYFKHDPVSIVSLYNSYPEALSPSEVAPRHWSKLLVDCEPLLVQPLMEKSYQLVRRTVTKQGEKAILESATHPNRFLVFYEAALQLSPREDIYVRYNDYESPALYLRNQAFS